jgi:hypothetical protein
VIERVWNEIGVDSEEIGQERRPSRGSACKGIPAVGEGKAVSSSRLLPGACAGEL